MMQDLEAHRSQIAAQQDYHKKKDEELAERLALVEGLENEKLELSRQQKDVHKQREELQLLDRRVRNSLGPRPSGPPVVRIPELLGTPPLPPVTRRSASFGSSPMNSARSSSNSKAKVHKKPQSVRPPASARDVSPLKTERSVSRTPPPL